MEIGGQRIPIALAVCFAVLYIVHSAPGIVFGDSAELALASASLGIAHAPGYPLYSLLTKAFHFIVPFVEYARGCNLFAAFISALSIVVLYRLLIESGVSVVSSVTACFCAGFSLTFFRQALISEVYALNSFFFLVSLSLLVMAHRRGDGRLFLAAAFLTGLGMGNHHTLLSVAVVGVARGVVSERLRRLMPLAAGFFMLGLSVYLYLPLRSSINPAIDLGDPENAVRAAEVIARKQFGFGNADFSLDRLWMQTLHYVSFLNDQLYPVTALLAVAGGVVLWRQNRTMFAIVTSFFLINGILTVYALNPVMDELFLVDEFLTPSFLIVAFLFAVAADRIVSMNRFAGIAVVVVAAALVPVKYVMQRSEIDRSGDRFARAVAADSLRILPPKAFVIGESDYSLFPLWYVQNMSGGRRDVAVLDADFLMLPWYQKQHTEKLPLLKDVIPDISAHGTSGAKKRIDFSVLEQFKLNQSILLAKNIADRMGVPVFFTFDLAEMAKIFSPEIANRLKPYGPLYYVSFDGTMPLPPPALDVTPFRSRLNLPPEELIFVTPYKSYLLREAESKYVQMAFPEALAFLENVYIIDPSAGNAANLALLVAETGGSLDRATALVNEAVRRSAVPDPRTNMVKGVIELRRNNYPAAARLLTEALNAAPEMCQAKLYLVEASIATGDRQAAGMYYGMVMRDCPDFFGKRAAQLAAKAGL